MKKIPFEVLLIIVLTAFVTVAFAKTFRPSRSSRLESDMTYQVVKETATKLECVSGDSSAWIDKEHFSFLKEGDSFWVRSTRSIGSNTENPQQYIAFIGR